MDISIKYDIYTGNILMYGIPSEVKGENVITKSLQSLPKDFEAQVGFGKYKIQNNEVILAEQFIPQENFISENSLPDNKSNNESNNEINDITSLEEIIIEESIQK